MTVTLKLTKPMMRGPAVKRLQEASELRGVEAGPHDGIFGEKTERAVKAIQEEDCLKVDGICGPLTWGAIDEALSDSDGDGPGGVPGIVDLRGTHHPPRLYSHKRSWGEITGVTLHQTGCTMSNTPSRWKPLNAHIGITRDGQVMLVNDPTDMIWHAQQLSHSTIGVEICGNYPGIENVEETLWSGGGGPDALNGEILAALDRAFGWISTEFEKHGQLWKHVHAHRQSSSARRSDPGSEIWRNVGLPWLAKIGGTDGGESWKTGEGRPIPVAWNPAYTTPY